MPTNTNSSTLITIRNEVGGLEVIDTAWDAITRQWYDTMSETGVRFPYEQVAAIDTVIKSIKASIPMNDALLEQILAEIRAGNSYLHDAGRNATDAEFRPLGVNVGNFPNGYQAFRTVHNAEDGAGNPVDVVITELYSLGIGGVMTLVSTTTTYLLEDGTPTSIKPVGLVWVDEGAVGTSTMPVGDQLPTPSVNWLLLDEQYPQQVAVQVAPIAGAAGYRMEIKKGSGNWETLYESEEPNFILTFPNIATNGAARVIALHPSDDSLNSNPSTEYLYTTLQNQGVADDFDAQPGDVGGTIKMLLVPQLGADTCTIFWKEDGAISFQSLQLNFQQWWEVFASAVSSGESAYYVLPGLISQATYETYIEFANEFGSAGPSYSVTVAAP